VSVIADIRARLSLDGKNFERGMLRAQRQTHDFRRVVDQQMRRAGVAIAGVTIAGGLIGASFEQSMAKVQAVSRAGEAQLAAMEQTARRLGSTTSFSARDSAEAMLILAQAGLDTNQIIGSTEAVLVGAGAGMTSMNVVAELLTQSLKRFNLEASDSGRVVNVIQAASQRTQTDFDRMAESMRYAGTVAGPFGVSLEETASLVAVLTDRLGDSAMAGTGARNVLAALAAPTRELSALVPGLNLRADGLEKSLQKVEAAGVPVEQWMTLLGKRGGPAMIQLLAAGSKEWAKLRDDITGTNDAFEAYEITQDTMQGAFLRLRSALEETAIAWTDTFKTRAKEALDAAAEAVNRNKDRIVTAWSRVSEVLFAAGKATVGLLGFLQAHDSTMRVLTGTAVTLTGALYGISLAMAAIGAVSKLNPILLVLGGLALGLNVLIEKTGGWQRAWIHVVDRIKKSGNEIAYHLTNWKTGFQEIWDGMKRGAETVGVLREAFAEELSRMWELAKVFGQGLALTMFNPRMAGFALDRFKAELERSMADSLTASWRSKMDAVWEDYGSKRRAEMDAAYAYYVRHWKDIEYETRLALARLHAGSSETNQAGLDELLAQWQNFTDQVDWEAPARNMDAAVENAERKIESLASRTERVIQSAWSSITDKTRTGAEKWRAIFQAFFQQIWEWIGETLARWIRMQVIMGIARAAWFALRTAIPLGGGSGIIDPLSGSEGFGPIGPDIGPSPSAGFRRTPSASPGPDFAPARGRGGGDTYLVIQGPVIAEDEVSWHRFLDRVDRDLVTKIQRMYRDPVTVTP